MSVPQFASFRASSLFCASCGTAQAVDEKLTLSLPEKEVFDYVCLTCGLTVGSRSVERPPSSTSSPPPTNPS